MLTIFTNVFQSGIYFRWWDNLYYYVLNSNSREKFSDRLKEELSRYNAVIAEMRPNFGGWAFEFESEEDVLAFLLRWD
jgi:hypothetical protein